MKAPLPQTEEERLGALHDYRILDTLPEPGFDDITRIASEICGAPVALVSLVDRDRQWFKSRVGVEASETPRDVSFCAHAILQREPLIVADALADPRFADNPFVAGDPGIRFYAGVPLVTGKGHALGTLCVLDRVPRELAESQKAALIALARQVMVQLELRYGLLQIRQNEGERRRYQQALEVQQRRLERSNAELRARSLTDGLTGLWNRRAFQLRFEEEWGRASRGSAALSLLLLEVDRFHEHQRALGRQAGDGLIRDVGRVLLERMRSHDFVARSGDAEFAVILPGTGREGSAILAERCRAAVEGAAWENARVTVSVGGATRREGSADPDALVADAGGALRLAREGGPNRVHVAG